MIENQTSKAVEELFQREQPSLMVLSAFQEKYQRMEEALKEIAKGHSGDTCCCGPCDVAASTALAFDPLK